MTERLAEVSAHLHAVRQVGAVVGAMRALAGTRAQQARNLLPGVRAYANVTMRAIAQALLLPQASAPAASATVPGIRPTLIAFGAEQGFAGGFADQVLAAIPEGDFHLLMIGSRSAALAAERGRALDIQLACPARATSLVSFAADLSERLFDHLRRSQSTKVDLVVPVWTGGAAIRIEHRALAPLDFATIPAEPAAQPPLTNLPAATLLDRLGEEYVFARLCEAVIDAYAAENQARVTAMAAARRKIEAQVDMLQRLEHRVRQQEITAEVIELAAGRRS